MKKNNFFLGILFTVLPIVAYLMTSTIVSSIVQMFYIAKIYENGIPSDITEIEAVTAYLTEELLKTDYTGTATFFADIVGAIIAFFWMRTLRRYSLPAKKVFNIKRVVILLSLGMFIQVATGLVMGLLFMILPESVSENYMELSGALTGEQTSVFMVLAVVVAAPVCEELFLRGLALQYGRKYMPDTAAIIITSLAFGMIHFSNIGLAGFSGVIVQVIYAFVYGIVLSYVTIKFKNVWASVLVHFAINGFAEILSFMNTESWITGVIMIIILLLSGDAAYFMFKKAGVPTEYTEAEAQMFLPEEPFTENI